MGLFDWVTGGANKRADDLSQPMEKYSGYRPPKVSFLRPVEDDITRILRERASGQDVGYDPRRREELLQNFDIQQGRDLEEQNADINNRISGMGLSRNPAVYDELMGRANREAGREKNLYRNRVDIEDLARRNEERDINTGRLQDLNTFNFGQDNQAADFDLRVFGQESGNELARRGIALGTEQYRQSPIGTALQVAGAASKFVPGGGGGEQITTSNGAPSNSIRSNKQNDYGQDAFSNYLSQLSLRNGKKLNY